MKSILSMASVAAIVLLAAAPAMAVPRTSYAAHDLKLDLQDPDHGIPDLFWIPGSGGIAETNSKYIAVLDQFGKPAQFYPSPPWYPYNVPVSMPYGFNFINFTDKISYAVDIHGPLNNTERYAAGAAYISWDDEADPTALITVTTVYGNDADPFTPDALSISGFDVSGPYPLLSNEQITGQSGVSYADAVGELVHISQLSSLLGPAFDLSIFTGDSSRSVWVFQTTMPFSEVLPEPASLAAISLVMPLLRRRR